MTRQGERREYCPECENRCENVDYEFHGDQDPDSYSETWFFECPDCGCEFEKTLRCDYEIEVTNHGKEYDEEEDK